LKCTHFFLVVIETGADAWLRLIASPSTSRAKGGHGANAYQTADPVLVAGHIITAVQSIVSRNVKPINSAVISLCAMQAGEVAERLVALHCMPVWQISLCCLGRIYYY